MTRAGRRLVEDFIVPALESGKYGELLKWIDRDQRSFSIRWSHKNAAKWSLEDTKVFQDWDSLKGHYNPQLKGYYMQAKQRFRAALYKLNSVVKVPCDDKHIKKYQLVNGLDKKKEFMARSKPRMTKKEENQKAIPTSVICKNTSYKVQDNSAPSEPASSPLSSSESECEDKELQRCMFEYTNAQRKQQQMSTMQALESQDLIIDEEASPMETDEDNQISCIAQKAPVQPQPIGPSVIPYYDINQKRYESPKILLVQTYHEEREEPDDDLRVGCVFQNPPGIQDADALNLSMKSDESSSR